MERKVTDPRLKNKSLGKSIGPDQKAQHEAKAFDQGSLEKLKKKNNFDRAQRFQNHLIQATIVIFWAGITAILSTGIVWFFHLLFPTSNHFLSDIQLDKIQAVLFSGMISSSLTGIARKYFSES